MIKSQAPKVSTLLASVLLITFGFAFAQPDTLWTRTYGGSSYEWAYSVDQTTIQEGID